ncbi:MAG: flagellar brake protein [Lachnospiraceae bacterium]|nr:flagellar brake protein [Lachnospiraceae bacterium]
MSHLIETGTKLELKKIRHVEAMEEISYVSRFLYQKSADEAVIEMPVKSGRMVPLEPGELFQVCFYTAKGLYQCQSQVVSRHYEDSLPVAIIKLRSEFEKLQRRQYYRMECLLQMEFCSLTEEEYDDLLAQKSDSRSTPAQKEGTEEKFGSGRLRFYSGVTLDISGGGVRFNSSHEAQPGDVIALRIAFMEEEVRKIQILFAKVLTVAAVQNRSGLFEHRVEFVSISNAERESIIRYIFLEEWKRRQRESGNE